MLKAHEEAVHSLTHSQPQRGPHVTGRVEAVAAMATRAAREAAREIHGIGNADTAPDTVTILRETLRVKDEELVSVSSRLRAAEATVSELSSQLESAVQAAESAAESAKKIEILRRRSAEEAERLRRGAQAMATELDRVRAELAKCRLKELTEIKQESPTVGQLDPEHGLASNASTSSQVDVESSNDIKEGSVEFSADVDAEMPNDIQQVPLAQENNSLEEGDRNHAPEGSTTSEQRKLE